MTGRPRAPEHLGDAGRRVWRQMIGANTYDAGELALLTGLCEQADRLDQAPQAVRRDGAFIQGRDGLKEHPALAAERSTLGVMLRLMRQLTPPPSPRRLGGLHEDGWWRYVRPMGRVVAQSSAITYLRAHASMKSDSRAVPGVGSAPQTEVIMGEQQERKAAPGEAEEPKSGWLARWRERRRSKSARGADIGRRLWEADRRNVDKAEKYGHGR